MEPPIRAPGFVNPPPRKRPSPPVISPPVTPPAATSDERQLPNRASAATNDVSKRPHSGQRTARAKKEKRIILGDHEVGFGRPPKEHQFKDRNKGGPGRPPGSKSQNSLLRAEFDRKHTAREGSKTIKTSARELISRLVVTGPITSRHHKDLAKLNALARDLYPDPVSEAGFAEAYDPALDQAVLQHLVASLQLGEACADGINPLADRATGRPDLGLSAGDDAWNEGNWDGNSKEASDEDR